MMNKNSTIHIRDKGLFLLIYKHLEIIFKKTNNPTEKKKNWVKHKEGA